MKTMTTAILVLLLSTSAIAQESLRLNGITVYNKHTQDYFIAALFLKKRNHSAGTILQAPTQGKISLKILKQQLSARRFNQYWLESISINNNQQQLNDYDNDILRFTRLINQPLLREDEVSITLNQQKLVEVRINNQLIGKFNNAGFFNVLLRSWIGKRPPSSQFKSQLLNLGSDPKTISLINTYTHMQASPERKKASAGWQAVDTKSGANSQNKNTTPKAVTELSVASAASTPTALKQHSEPSPPLTVHRPSKATTITKQLNDHDSLKKKQQQSRQLSHRSNILKETYRHITYPNIAIDGNLEGDIILTIVVDRKGEVITLNQNQLSPHHSLNSAAIKAVRKSNYPAAPNALAGEEFVVKLPIKFRLPK
ncbi:TonB family protein [Sinobacterium caligoides]|uniref:TonB family protein n=1 Tax=Sinobacterium caligoides TaxID=933926 RepID=A0A3N2D514_9GAMM|nr:TonB family protein [Sinobacterium caligoides]ROR94738.1 TonB family protein [Sinobacterium caligoides]